MLASRFAPNSPVLRSDHPLSDDQIRAVAPSIFAEAKHQSRSDRYSYIPTSAVLSELRKEGFAPFMYSEGALYQVYASPGRVTDIVLQEGEALTSVSAGDTVRWIVGDTTSERHY